MAAETGVEPAVLREQVTSKGGTTAAALAVFEAGGFRALVDAAVAAAARRSAIYRDEKFSDHAPITIDYDLKLI